MTKNSLSVAVLSIVAIVAGGILVSAPAFARQGEGRESNFTANRGGGEREDSGENEGRNNKPIKWTVSCAAVTSTAMASASVQSYSDVLSVLNADNQIVQAILLTNTTTAPTGGLSVAETALLNVLRGKRGNTPNTVAGRGNDVGSQIQTLLGVVQPLGNATISAQLKKPLVNALKDLNNQINNLSKLTCKRVPVFGQPNIPVAPPVTNTTTATALTTYTMAQVQAANSAQNCLAVISGGVYNLTSWISQHPGGSGAILSICGKDGTAAFMNQHGGQGNPMNVLTGYKVGVLQ